MNEIYSQYNKACNSISDINEHLPILAKYASECDSVIELGVRGCVSSWAFLYGLLQNKNTLKKIFLNDIEPCEIQPLLDIASRIDGLSIAYEWKNDLDVELSEPYDLTFIDTWHVYGQLKRELDKYSKYTNKYMIMHDTTIDEWEGEAIRSRQNAKELSVKTGIPLEEITRGLWPAIVEFLEVHPEWILHQRYTNNNGLTILQKIRSED